MISEFFEKNVFSDTPYWIRLVFAHRFPLISVALDWQDPCNRSFSSLSLTLCDIQFYGHNALCIYRRRQHMGNSVSPLAGKSTH